MNPVFSYVHPVKGGNCFSAAFASVVDLPLEAVPQCWENEWDYERITREMQEFLRRNNIGGCTITPDDRPDGLDNDPAKYWSYALGVDMRGLDMFWVATGAVIDGNKVYGHAVVYYNNRLVHDPDPNGYGIQFPCNGHVFKRGASDDWVRGRVDAVTEGWFK